MKVYSAKIFCYDPDNFYKRVVDYLAHYPYGEDGFELIEESLDTIYSTQEKALDAAQKKIKEYELNAQLIVVESNDLDNEEDDSKTIIYNLRNKKLYEYSFCDYDHKEILYKKGDWVLFCRANTFQIGRIGAEAEGKEPYLILTENNCLNDGYSHDHVEEPWIVTVLNSEEVEKILPYKFFSNINIRYEYNSLKKV